MEQSTKPLEFQATAEWVKRLAGDYYHVRFSLTKPDTISFVAGQYVIFDLPPPKRRHTMSLVSTPSDHHAIDILQSVAPMGQGSKWVLGLKPGDPVSFVGPVGKFLLSEDTGRQKVFVATGCGIAPFRSMLLDYLTTGRNSPVVLYWGLRFERDVFWQEELRKLVAEHRNFHYHVTLSKPSEAWMGMKGRVTDHIVDKAPALLDSEFYLCGNREMIVEVRKQLTDKGVLADQIFAETFF
jgi:NAD(P)H-flavin reductase